MTLIAPQKSPSYDSMSQTNSINTLDSYQATHTPDSLALSPSSPKSPENDSSAPQSTNPKQETQENHPTYSLFTGYSFSINFILGVGILGIPMAFQSGGIALSFLFLLFVTIVSYICVMWLLETIARAESMQQRMDEEEYERIDEEIRYEEEEEEKAHGRLVTPLSGGMKSPVSPASPAFSITDSPKATPHAIGHRKFEISQMMGIFLYGRLGKTVWDLLLFFYMSVALISYCSVFGSAFASKIPLPLGFEADHPRWYTCDIYKDNSWDCHFCYSAWVTVFGGAVVLLSMLNLTEQKIMQVSLTIFRYVCVILMVGTALYAMFCDPYSSQHVEHDVSHRKVPYIAADLGSWKQWATFAKFYTVFPTAIYSQLLHHSIPGLEHPIPIKKKKYLPIMFGMVFVTTFVGYTLLGTVMVLYYGSEIESSISLNFGFFRGGASFSESIPFWVYPIVWTIILFPAIDCVSVFPLCVITTAENLRSSFLQGTRWMEYRSISMVFRFITAIPPLIIGLFVSDLSKILNYVGIIGIGIAYNVPAILQIASMYKTRKVFGYSDTVYSYRIISNYALASAVFLFGIVAIVMIFVFNIWGEISGHD